MLNLSLGCELDDKLWRDTAVNLYEPGIPDSSQCVGDSIRVWQANRHGSHFAKPERMTHGFRLR